MCKRLRQLACVGRAGGARRAGLRRVRVAHADEDEGDGAGGRVQQVDALRYRDGGGGRERLVVVVVVV